MKARRRCRRPPYNESKASQIGAPLQQKDQNIGVENALCLSWVQQRLVSEVAWSIQSMLKYSESIRVPLSLLQTSCLREHVSHESSHGGPTSDNRNSRCIIAGWTTGGNHVAK